MRRLAASIAAALLIASAGAALGVETINGKPLSDVHDIVREVNGDDTFVPKTQILKLKQVGRDLQGDLWAAPYDQGRSGSHTKKTDVVKMTGVKDLHHLMGIMSAASTRRLEGGKRRVVVGDIDYDGGGGIKTFVTEPTGDVSIKISGSMRSLPITTGYDRNNVITDIRGGLFIDGEEDESFVVGFMNDLDRKHTFGGGDNGGQEADVRFLILDGRKLNDEGFTGDPTAYTWEWEEVSESQFPVTRIVAGDFDGDGIASEIAWVQTPGGASFYILWILKVRRDSSGNVELERFYDKYNNDVGFFILGNIYLTPFHGAYRDTEAAVDIVAGDFDGDGSTELAVVMISDGGDSDLKPTVSTIKFVDSNRGKIFIENRGAVLANDFPNLCDTKTPGVLAAAGDFDGDGKDEVAFATVSPANMIHLATVAFDPVDGGAPMPVLKHHRNYEYTISRKFTPLASIMSLAAGPSYAAAGSGGGFCDELYDAHLRSDGKTIVFNRLTDPLNKLEPHALSSATDAAVPALVIADLAGESMILGEPDHIITQDTRSYYTILPAVPYHIDYIRSDWRNAKDTPDPSELQFITPPSNSVTYSRAQSDSATKDTSFESCSHFETEIGASLQIKKPFKYISLKGGVEGAYRYSHDDIEKKLSSHSASISSRIDAVAQDHDSVHYYNGTLHVWRYPIVGVLGNDPVLKDEMFTDDLESIEDAPHNDPLKNVRFDPKGQMYYTVMRLVDIEPGYSGADAGDRHQPDYDERNLFSYPNDLNFSKSYQNKLRELSPAHNFSTNSPVEKTITFDSISSETNSEVYTSNHGGSGTISGGLGIPGGKIKVFTLKAHATFSGNYMASNGTTFTAASKASTSYGVKIQEDYNAADSGFDVDYSAFIDVAGMTTLGFAVDLRPGIDPATAWSKWGPYGTSPDPSLVLPNRVHVGSQTNKDGYVVKLPKPNTNLTAATRLRGVRIYDLTADEDPSVGSSYTVSSLIKGRKYTVVVPIYNASFKDTASFDVQLGYMTSDHLDELEPTKRAPASDDKEIHLIAKKTMSLKGWVTGSDAHRAAAEFDWTVPTNMPEGNYELCVRIVGRDGDIHRDWNLVEGSSGYDPCGNDWGHYSIAVYDESNLSEELEKLIQPASASDGDLRTAASTSEPEVGITFNVEDQPPMTFEEFRRWMLGRTDPIDVKIVVANTGDRFIHNAFVTIYERLEDGRMRDLFDGDLTSLFPGKSVSRYVRIDPQRFMSRDIRAKIIGASISQTYGEPTEGASGGSGSGGCAAGAAGVAAIALLAAATRRRK